MQALQMTFLNPAGTVLFVRDDMEQGNWTQEEYTINCTFPHIAGKVIERGQRVCFRDQVTGNLEFFEIRNVTNIEPDHYQQIIAESIAVSELSDEHINTQEITDKTPAQALTTALTGTLWAVGNVTATNVSSGDISRGSVWQAVQGIASNWNCYITPRVTTAADGSITGRYLDIAPAQGTWRGLRLTISKNVSDSSVVYDDSEVLTALYGYGGNVDVYHANADDTQEELTLAGVEWTATADHPAKPLGQLYLEDPAKTTLYGRNGRPRYGYYQNGDIKDGATLLEKTWEALKATSDPKISITGTVTDLYRLGYAGEPLRLHDTVLVEVTETGEKFVKQVIRLDIDLIDPTATRPEIGSYIPNIIYINRESMELASGGGGGGGRGKTNKEDTDAKTYATLQGNTDHISLVVGQRSGNSYIQAGEITLAINETGTPGSYETTAYIDATHVNISATDTAYALAGEMYLDANRKLVIQSAGGMYVRRTESGITAEFGVFDDGNLTGGVCVNKINGQRAVKISGDVIDINGSSIVISADRIDLSGYVTASQLNAVDAEISNLTSGATTASSLKANLLSASTGFTYQSHSISFKNITINGTTYHLMGY